MINRLNAFYFMQYLIGRSVFNQLAQAQIIRYLFIVIFVCLIAMSSLAETLNHFFI